MVCGVLWCFVLFCGVLCCFVVFCVVLCCFVLFCVVWCGKLFCSEFVVLGWMKIKNQQNSPR